MKKVIFILAVLGVFGFAASPAFAPLVTHVDTSSSPSPSSSSSSSSRSSSSSSSSGHSDSSVVDLSDKDTSQPVRLLR